MPSERRTHHRIKKRLPVVLLGEHGEHGGFTINLSSTGMCIGTDHLFGAGSTVIGRLVPPTGAPLPFSAEVRWVRKVRGSSTLTEKSSMGLHFLQPVGPGYDALLGTAAPRTASVPRQEPPPLFDLAAGGEPQPVAEPQKAGRAKSSKAPAAVPVLPSGAEATVGTLIKASDVSPEGSLLLPRAAEWVEQAALEALAGQLTAGIKCLAVSLELSLVPDQPLGVGTLIVTHARLAAVDSGGHRLTFTVKILDGEREIAFARHMRSLTAPRRGRTSRPSSRSRR